MRYQRGAWAQRTRSSARLRPLKRALPPVMAPSPAAGQGKRFLLQNLLGAGGVCEVFTALDLRRAAWSDADPRVAVKRLLPHYARHYQAQLFLAQEFAILRHLTHPGVVRVFDLHEEPFGLCYSMELLEGSAMSPVPGGMGEAGFAAVGSLFGALAYLHRCGVAHGDIKPSNVILLPGGRVVLIDFNTASLTEGDAAALPGQGRGLRHNLRIPAHSERYSSPERLAGEPPSAAGDVFSACCTAYEYLSGRHPLQGASWCEAQYADLPIHPVEGMPSALWKVLRRGLESDPALRPDADSLCRRFAAPGVDYGLRALLRRYLPL